jgi:cytochrome P450
MQATLDDQVRMMESSWFMSYPHDVYARLRREAPVYWSPRDQVWAISKYEDVRWISKTPELFANGYHVYVTAAAAQDTGQEIDGDTGMPRRAEIRRVDGLGPTRVDNLVMTDGDRHRFLRKIASHAFTPKAINQLEAQVQQIASDLFDEIPDEVEVDFVDTVAAPLPMIMIALMLGVPLDRLGDFRRWSDSFIEFADESTHGDPEFESRVHDIIEFRDYFSEQLQNRVANPRDDLLTELVRAEWEGKPLELEEQLSMAQVLLIAGNETTRGLLAGAGQAMFEHPDQRRILVDAPELIAPAVEEFLRYVTPVTHMCRTALADVEIRGEQIRRGDFLCLLYPAANRDEDIWDRADELDVTRDTDNAHVAFGFAEHFCLGASLARREARIVLTELLARFPNYELVGDTTRTHQHMTPGIKTMPAVFHR